MQEQEQRAASKQKREISQNPNAGRPAIKLKTPRSNLKERPSSGYPGTTKNQSQAAPAEKKLTQTKSEPNQAKNVPGNTRRKFVIKKLQNNN
jgi:hypothetical protein